MEAKETSSSSTLGALEEFRRRKAAAQAKIPEKSENGSMSLTSAVDLKARKSARPRAVSDSASNGVRMESTPSPRIVTQTSSSLSNSHWDRFSAWLYRMVMPEHLMPQQNGSSAADDGDDVDDVEDSDQFAVDTSEPGSASRSSLASKLLPWLKTYYLWWILAWSCGFGLAVRYGWGAVYFCLSILLLISKSLNDTRRKKRGAPSAYSVFNENLERIDGTLDAEQLQRQMFFRF